MEAGPVRTMGHSHPGRARPLPVAGLDQEGLGPVSRIDQKIDVGRLTPCHAKFGPGAYQQGVAARIPAKDVEGLAPGHAG